MSALPSVSVCLTAYRRAHLIAKSIESLLGQTLGDFELIIADDASADGTEEVCRAYEQIDRRVRYFKQETNVGMPANLNAAIRRARAPLIANLHDGDVYRLDLLDRWKTALDEQPDAAFVFNSYVRLDENGAERGVMSAGLPSRFEPLELVTYMLDPARCFSSPVWGTVMGRARCYSEVGGFDPRYSFVSDVALWLRCNLRFPVAYVDAPLIRLHQGEMDRPMAYTNWALEEAIVHMYREAARSAYSGAHASTVLSRLLRRQERRWLAAFGSCLRNGRLERAREGLAAFRRQGSWVLSGSAIAMLPVVAAAERSAAVRAVIGAGANTLKVLRTR